MLLDFLTSRWMMLLGGLLLIGVVLGVHETLSAVPEAVSLDTFTRDWAEPILIAYRGVGHYDGDSNARVERGRHIVFGDHVTEGELADESYRPYKRPPSYGSKEISVSIYRDAILFDIDGRFVRIPIPDRDRTHLWYASNADEYTAEDEAWLDDAATDQLQVDFTKPLVIRRNVNAEGEWSIYITQSDWVVLPETCQRDVIHWPDGTTELSESCTSARRGEPVFLLRSSDGTPLAGEVSLTLRNVALDPPVASPSTLVDGLLQLSRPVPQDPDDTSRVYVVHEELGTAAALPAEMSEIFVE